MLQTIALATAFLGTTIAAAWDLKTTEVPDQVPYAMIVIALILFGYQSISEWSYQPILFSVIAGLAFLAFGFIMYYFGQWGGADALLLGSIGFLLPKLTIVKTLFPFSVSYLFNLFIVGAGYMLVYAFVFALMNRQIFSKFFQDLKASSNMLLLGFLGLFVLFFGSSWYTYRIIYNTFNISSIISFSLFPFSLVIFIFLIWKFAKAVEDHGFKKIIPVSKLKVGDMLLKEKKLIGITKEQLTKIKKSGKRFVEIKEGVRFAVAFPLALLFTLLYGDIIFLLIKVIGL
jgi:Flp pilus assembly protein protease CpaA